MAIDRSFFSVTAQGVDALAGAAGADIVRGADRQAVDAAPVFEAGPGHLCFLTEKADKTLIARLSGAVVITTPALAEELPEDCAALVCGNPRLGFARALGLMVAEIGACHPPQQAVTLDGVT
ncbi:MAG: LpxD N-terminal domain-containing protein, partial [SAR116 cluster bacterium]